MSCFVEETFQVNLSHNEYVNIYEDVSFENQLYLEKLNNDNLTFELGERSSTLGKVVINNLQL